MNLALLGHLVNLFFCCVWVSIQQVEHDAVVEQDSVLRDDRNILSETFECQVLDILAIYQDPPLSRVVHSKQQIQQSGLSESALPHNGIGGSWLDLHRKVLEK